MYEVAATRLRELAHPMAEVMSDGARLTEFVRAAVDAANEIDQMKAAVDRAGHFFLGHIDGTYTLHLK